LSVSSSESQATAPPVGRELSQATTAVVLPNPAGAETSVSFAAAPRPRRAVSRPRSTTPARSFGTNSFVAISEPGRMLV
jgi:hypothetical protein